MLNSSSISRGHYYLVSEISEAVKKQTGKIPLLHCRLVEVDDSTTIFLEDDTWVPYLDWIGICLDKDYLEPVDCLTNATQFCHRQHALYSISEEEEDAENRGQQKSCEHPFNMVFRH